MVGAWHGHGMASVNQTRPHCVNQMGKTHSKHLAARHGRGTAWERHAMCETAFIESLGDDNVPLVASQPTKEDMRDKYTKRYPHEIIAH